MKEADKILTRLRVWCNNGRDIVISNFYYGRYEMDMFRLTSSGYVVEYEVKVSRSDFKADFEKKHNVWGKGLFKKHEEIQNGNQANRFFFVVPKGLVRKDEVPQHAGLIYYDANCDSFSIVKHAPLIHKLQVADSYYKTLSQKLAFRESNLRYKLMAAKYAID